MGHADGLDHESLTRELLAGAHAWQIGDWASAVNRLRAAFEVLTQARERFYPVDAYLIDLCLLDPAMPAGVLGDPLEKPVRHLVHRPGAGDREPGLARPAGRGRAAAGDHRRLGRRRGRWLLRGRRSALAAGVDPLAVPAGVRGLSRFTSTIGTSRLSRGGGSAFIPNCRRSPSGSDFGMRCTWGSTRGGSRSVPRPSDSGRAPTAAVWRALLRPPLAADRPSQGWLVPWRMAATMKNDHVAALPLVHWPQAGRSVVSRPAPGRRLFAGPGALDDAQRLLPPDRSPVRDVPSRARSLPDAVSGPGGGPARGPSRSHGWPAITGCGHGWRRCGRSRRWRGPSRASAAGAGDRTRRARRICPRSRRSKT